ncbi:MAG: DNA-processing protein DprA [Clostridiales bacterium]|jgi:DNA processing protein|nr:DNA-processing protein DprA [Clostridiales bacterium]
MADENLRYEMWLSAAPGVGASRARALMKLFRGARGVFDAAASDFGGIRLESAAVKYLTDPARGEKAEKLWRSFLSTGADYINRSDARYPAALSEIAGAPLGLYVMGRLPADSDACIAVVGTRRASDYGLTAAFGISRDLALRGLAVVSGMALGIDSAAHRGALEGGGLTVAVLGSGIDVIYPPANADLFAEIAEKGAVVTEFAPGQRPIGENFPRRNRIISGLSLGVLVVEAGLRSGANITVERALSQGREVFAVPGSIYSAQSAGPNRFIKDGACLVSDYTDILSELGIDTERFIEHNQKPAERFESAAGKPQIWTNISEDERAVLNQIGTMPITVDEISLRGGLDIQKTLVCLTSLELIGAAVRMPGQRYVRGHN